MILKLPTTLIVIGNGFDLYHGIKSKYSDFVATIKAEDSDLFECMQKYLPGLDEWWWNLEEALGAPDVDQMMDDAGQFLMSYGDENWSDSGHHDYQYELDKIAETLSRQLLKRFTEWVHGIAIPSHPLPNLTDVLLPEYMYFSFNYTQTLESTYQIPVDQVLHIHGSTMNPATPFVLGHGYDKLPSRNEYYPGIEDEDVRVMEGNDIIDAYFKRTFKPSGAIIESNQAFFEKMRPIETVYVLGHSLAEVDEPYILAISNTIARPARWIVASQSLNDGKEKVERLEEIGITNRSIEAVLWTNLSNLQIV